MANTPRKDQNQDQESHGKQGFASMPKEKVQEIASKGGKSSHGSHHTDENTPSDRSRTSNQSENTGHGKQGFASMPKEKVQEIASKGGKSSHGSHHEENDEDNRTKNRK